MHRAIAACPRSPLTPGAMCGRLGGSFLSLPGRGLELGDLHVAGQQQPVALYVALGGHSLGCSDPEVTGHEPALLRRQSGRAAQRPDRQ